MIYHLSDDETQWTDDWKVAEWKETALQLLTENVHTYTHISDFSFAFPEQMSQSLIVALVNTE